MATNSLITPVAGLGTSSFSPSRNPTKLNLSSGFLSSRATANPFSRATRSKGRFSCFKGDWLRTDLNVIGFGLIGWIAPSSVPVINGKSLTGLFFESIGSELAHWPTGPALTSQFWLWMICWHFGLFLCLTFGQIGFKGRNEYF
ncbi:hypothetical protein AMTRI_Chr09g17120 [Amborella trichopoda]|uniref:Photosystem I subunit O n=1 Tax=Amborella trichopoda TaxID=13333 RepID=W1PLV4_AMBTC|nr:photosystem I subunit O [Amborella trichopoda]ERN08135.1 hypothetical protein AMTR_s00018p00092490 [Amborella trichopoda]|eukprot:XP_006846460.1 photosystem I subunit O [Amborella trichopoda]